MQPQLFVPYSEHEQARLMEQVMMTVRCRWFGAREFPGSHAVALVEPGGEMLLLVDGDPAQTEQLMAEAAHRGAYIVATDFSRPLDLRARLRRAGFRPIQHQAVYRFEPSAAPAEDDPAEGGLLRWLRQRRRLHVAIQEIPQERLPDWNAVCWRAFGTRGPEINSLREKQFAFRNMGAAGRWYLATHDGAPVGTAMLFQDGDAAQVLAVGTHPDYRGRGVATALMHRLIDDWTIAGTGLLFLDTAPGSAAEQLYQHLGFRLAYAREIYAPGVGP